MELLINDNVYGWKMTGLLGKDGKWFFGFSAAPVKAKYSKTNALGIIKISTMKGKAAYELDVKRNPIYPDGTNRKTWEQLGEIEKISWETTQTGRNLLDSKTDESTPTL